MTTDRPPGPRIERVRIVGFDEKGAVLLMKWRDSVSGRLFWEPPGGGIEEGESALAAAQRELLEETGYRAVLGGPALVVARDYEWLGRRFVHDEAFFATRLTGQAAAAALTGEEAGTLLELRFVAPEALASLDAPLEPPALVEIVSELSAAFA